MTMAARQKVVACAQTWLGTPYHHAAQVKGAGVDCAQLLIAVYVACAVMPSDFMVSDYPIDWHLHRDEERYLSHVLRYAVPTDTPQIGDIALFKFGRTVSHGGIMVGDSTMIHAYRPSRAVVQSDLAQSGDLQARCAGYYTMKEWL